MEFALFLHSLPTTTTYHYFPRVVAQGSYPLFGGHWRAMRFGAWERGGGQRDGEGDVAPALKSRKCSSPSSKTPTDFWGEFQRHTYGVVMILLLLCEGEEWRTTATRERLNRFVRIFGVPSILYFTPSRLIFQSNFDVIGLNYEICTPRSTFAFWPNGASRRLKQLLYVLETAAAYTVW